MREVSVLPKHLLDIIAGRDVIVFDGECVLCSGFSRFIMTHDRAERFHFVIAQSDLGTKMYQTLGLPISDFETNLVIVDGGIYEKLDAFAAAMRALGGIWALLAVCRFLPGPLKNGFYAIIARNRYALFGRQDTCMLPDAAVRARFLDVGQDRALPS